MEQPQFYELLCHDLTEIIDADAVIHGCHIDSDTLHRQLLSCTLENASYGVVESRIGFWDTHSTYS